MDHDNSLVTFADLRGAEAEAKPDRIIAVIADDGDKVRFAPVDPDTVKIGSSGVIALLGEVHQEEPVPDAEQRTNRRHMSFKSYGTATKRLFFRRALLRI
jgi:hypothetical protein